MPRPRRLSNTTRIARSRGEDLSKLSIEVLKLHLQALNLPITGFKGQLLTRLNQASRGKASQSKRRPGRPQRSHSQAQNIATQEPSTAAGEIDATQSRRPSIPEDSALSDCASLLSIKDMLQSDAEEDLFHTDQSGNRQDALSPAQCSAIEDIVSQSVHSALHAVRANSAFSPTPNQTLAASGMVSPLGLSRPVNRNMEDKILRGEYVDLALL